MRFTVWTSDFGRCDGFPGAALEAMVNEAAIRAARRNSKTVGLNDFELAVAEFMQSRESTRLTEPSVFELK